MISTKKKNKILVGGGGLISGIATAIKSRRPEVKIVAAEPAAVDDCKQSFEAKKLLVTDKNYTICDGVRTNIGKKATWYDYFLVPQQGNFTQ